MKVSVSGTTYEVARRKMLRSLVEFRIRGVKVYYYSSQEIIEFKDMFSDEHSILVPSSDARCLHCREDLDNGARFARSCVTYCSLRSLSVY